MRNYDGKAVGQRLSPEDEKLARLVAKKGYRGCMDVLGDKYTSTYIHSHLRGGISATANSAEYV